MIPKLIHQIWTQGCEKIPIKYHNYIEGWKDLSKYGYTYYCWDDNSLKKVIKEFDPELVSIYDYFILPQQRSDLGRYIIIYLYGGFYIDIDIEPTGLSLDSILNSKFVISKNEYYIRQSFFGSVPKNIILSESIQHIKTNYERRFYEIFDLLFVERTTGGIISSLIKNKYEKEVTYISQDKVYICESIDDCVVNKNGELIAMIHFEKSWNILKYIHRFLIFYSYSILVTSIFLIFIIYSSCNNNIIDYLCSLKKFIILLLVFNIIYIFLNIVIKGTIQRDSILYIFLLGFSYYSLIQKCNKCQL